jgi:hypothetical protein
MSLQHTEYRSTKTEYHSIHTKKNNIFTQVQYNPAYRMTPLHNTQFSINMNTECVLTLQLCVTTPHMLPCPHALKFQRAFLQEIQVQI